MEASVVGDGRAAIHQGLAAHGGGVARTGDGHDRAGSPPKPDRLGYYLAVIGFALAALLCLKIWFSEPAMSVDGTVMSESEVAVVRSVRETEILIKQRTDDKKDSLASATVQLMQRGSDDGALHESTTNR